MADITRQDIDKAIKAAKVPPVFGTPIVDPVKANKIYFENQKQKKQSGRDEQKGTTLV